MGETHCGHFASDSVELGDRDGVRGAGYRLEAALGELHKCVDILRTPINRLSRKSAKLVDVELTPALCEAKIILDAECARLWVRHIRQRTACISLTASVLMNN